MKPEKIYKQYKPQIEKIMAEIRSNIVENSAYHVSDVTDMTSDEYYWNINLSPDGDIENSVDIDFRICESEEYDGSENGINFMVSITGYGGNVIGGFSPYNYTSKCWVSRNKPEEIKERFEFFKECDYSTILDLLNEYYKEG